MADLKNFNEGRTITVIDGQSPIKENWKYCVLSATEPYALGKAVNQMMDKGWAPQGGVGTGPTGTLFQAVVRT